MNNFPSSFPLIRLTLPPFSKGKTEEGLVRNPLEFPKDDLTGLIYPHLSQNGNFCLVGGSHTGVFLPYNIILFILFFAVKAGGVFWPCYLTV